MHGRSSKGRVREGDALAAKACYRSRALIQALCERRLYKLAFSLDSKQLEEIVKHREREDHSDIEAELIRLIEHLKGGEDVPPMEGRQNREALERAMEVEAGWPEDSIIIYVSPRRSQAKGIETGALAGTKTLTLRRHPDVKGDVESLNQAYLRLWKLVVLVHPGRVGEVVSLSKGVDELARRLFQVDPGADASAGDLGDACWLGYVRPQHRAAVPRFQQLNPEGAPLHFLQLCEELVEARPKEAELADGATFVKLLCDGMREDAARGVIKEHFNTPHALSSKVAALRPSAAKDSRDKIAEIEQTQRILTTLAEEFRPS